MSVDLEKLAPLSDRLEADLHELASYVEPAQPGWSREVFCEPYHAERVWVRERMKQAGLEVSVDPVGNVVGRLPGLQGGPPLVTGSHTDTVNGGGRFDGVVGVLAGIEIARRLRETGTRLQHDLLLIDFFGEEANPFGVSCFGSRAVAGTLTPAHLDRRNADHRRLGDVMTNFGTDPNGSLGQTWHSDSIAAFVELHIEQGPTLEHQDVPIGIVTGISGIERLLATFTGRPDHAGTMPMEDRKDALVAAAEAVLTVERESCAAPSPAVSTTGRIDSLPGAFNVVPHHARIWAEMRSADADWLNGAKRRIAERIAVNAAARGVDAAIEWLNDQAPVPAHPNVQDVIGRASSHLGIPWVPIPSGAGHDSAHMARLGPMGMIFIPSHNGRSHCPEEWTDISHIVTGTHVLAATLAHLDTVRHEETL